MTMPDDMPDVRAREAYKMAQQFAGLTDAEKLDAIIGMQSMLSLCLAEVLGKLDGQQEILKAIGKRIGVRL